MNVKGFYKQLRTWQLEPFSYEDKSEKTVRCLNCDKEFAGAFCPRCGQKSSVGRITWKSVRQNITMLWGLESRSMLYTLLQILLRPGYLISDYLDGKRQRTYPPVKLLVVVGVIVLLCGYFFPSESAVTNLDNGILDRYVAWSKTHPAWGMLVQCLVIEIPTWLMFRYSPRHPKHTLPEGFFIQVFIAPAIVIFDALSEINNTLNIFLIPYYIVTYRQLFGYSWWGTIWRTSVCLVFTFMFMVMAYIIELTAHSVNSDKIIQNSFSIVVLLIPLLITLFVSVTISKRTAKKRAKRETVDEIDRPTDE